MKNTTPLTSRRPAPDTPPGIWRYGAADSVKSGPIDINNKIYFGCKNGYYYCVDDAAGTIVANWPYTSASGQANAGPWIDQTNSHVIFGTTAGNLDAFSLE